MAWRRRNVFTIIDFFALLALSKTLLINRVWSQIKLFPIRAKNPWTYFQQNGRKIWPTHLFLLCDIIHYLLHKKDLSLFSSKKRVDQMAKNPTTEETHRKGPNKRGKKASPWETSLTRKSAHGRNTLKIDFQCEEKVILQPQTTLQVLSLQSNVRSRPQKSTQNSLLSVNLRSLIVKKDNRETKNPQFC